MSQRESGYERKERDLYETPEWVTECLYPHLPTRALRRVWEPACGSGRMASVIAQWGAGGMASDIKPDPCYPSAYKADFLQVGIGGDDITAIITNPPYELAQAFIEHALQLMDPVGGLVAMLLRCDFDHAKSRTHLFRDCPAFAKKLVLMKRITWFVEDNGKPKASPSFNHAWFLWDHKHEGPPTIGYAP